MGYDNILVQVGEFGLYQKLLCGFFVFYTTFLCGLNYYTQVWICMLKLKHYYNLYFRCSFLTHHSTDALIQFLTISKNNPAHLGRTCSHGSQDKEDTQGRYRILAEVSLASNEFAFSSQCLMVDPETQSNMFLNQTQTYFDNLKIQDSNPDKFTGIRRSVISFVENVPHKSCDSGWKYDHSLVFNTISSEVWHRKIVQNSN